jgi:hypothetical protein
MHYRRLNNKDWTMIEERIEKKLSSWKGNYLSVCGRLELKRSMDQEGRDELGLFQNLNAI